MVFDSGEVPEAQPLPTMLQREENDGFPPLVTGEHLLSKQAGKGSTWLLYFCSLAYHSFFHFALGRCDKPDVFPSAFLGLPQLPPRETRGAVVPVLSSGACLCAERSSLLDSHFDVVPESREMGVLAWLWK